MPEKEPREYPTEVPSKGTILVNCRLGSRQLYMLTRKTPISDLSVIQLRGSQNP